MQSSRLLVLPRALRVSAPAADVGSPEHPLHTRPHSLCHSLASPALDTARTPPRPPWPTVEARTRRNARCSAPSQPKPSSSVPPPRRAAHLARSAEVEDRRSATTTGRRRRRRHVHVAKPPRALSRPSKVTSGCAMTSWCFPTPPSAPTRLRPAGTESSGEIPCFPRDQGPRG